MILKHLSPAHIGSLTLVFSAFDIIMCPYTKVEESFNLQATHDLLYHLNNISEYDHLEFPGVVPRTFIGPLVVASLSAIPVFLLKLINADKSYALYISRFVLYMLVVLSFSKFCSSIKKKFGYPVAAWLVLVTLSQFHFKYYSSRPLPNTYALILVLLAYHYWIEQDHHHFVVTSGAAIIIFRSELAVLFGIILLIELCSRRLSFWHFLRSAFPTAIISIALTILVDSFFWHRFLWPEAEVFIYNTYYNRSSAWGVSPFLWYFYSAIPRAMAFSVFLLPVGLYLDKRVQALIFPAMVFVCLYSFLPHKELRFIIYVFPLFNVAVAVVCHRLALVITQKKIKVIKATNFFVEILMYSHILFNGCISTMLLFISYHNYPGGVALDKLHSMESPSASISIHIDVYSAQTGISKFLQINDKWSYNKTENLVPGSAEMLKFTHLLIGENIDALERIKIYENTHKIIETVDCFSHVSFKNGNFPPFKIHTKRCIWILKRKAGIEAKIYPQSMKTKPI